MLLHQAHLQDLTAEGGQKPKGRATFLKYSIGCVQHPGGQTWNTEAQISNGGPGTTGLHAGDGPVLHTLNLLLTCL